MLKVSGLFKTYTLGDSKLEILRGLDLNVKAGEFVAILGASGTGKSTLLHLLGGLDRPDAGEIEIAGERLLDDSEEAVALRRNRQIGFVFQFHHLLPEFTALENVAIPLKIKGTPDRTALADARARLEEVGLGERLGHIPSQLSGGERQRVAVARALVHSPDLLLMDEPTGNLDPKSGESLFHLVTAIQKKKQLTVVMVTHNMDLASHTDRRLVMQDGKLAELP
jgi:lipoprotein-releasing system ATP-binding protein